MARAIGAALRRLNAAIDEILAGWIPDRPSAGAFADLLESHLQHLSDLGFGERPCRLPLARDGGDGGALPQRLCASDRWSTRPLCDRPRRSERRTMDMAGKLDADPVRLADHGVARWRAERRGNGARAFSFKRHLSQSSRSPHRSTYPTPSVTSVAIQVAEKTSLPLRRRAGVTLTVTRSIIVIGTSCRLYNMVNTTKR